MPHSIKTNNKANWLANWSSEGKEKEVIKS